MNIANTPRLRGEVTIPGDKSISHRAVMFGSIANGITEVTNFLEGADCLSTISCFQKMGIDIERRENAVIVHGKGLHGLTAPTDILDVGNSGTTTRLISGILAGQQFTSHLDGRRFHPETSNEARHHTAADDARRHHQRPGQ